MSGKGFLERLMDIGGAGTALTASTTATSLLPTGSRGTLPANYFNRVGQSLLLKASGRISTVVTTPGTLNLYLRFGSIDVFDTGAMTLNVVAKTDVHWSLEAELVCRAIGSGTTATLIAMGGKFTSHAVIGAAAVGTEGAGVHPVPYNAAPAVGTGFDSEAAQLIDFFGKWSISNANSIRLEALAVDIWS